ncbi:MAG: hypothetical protein FD169_2369 [Bacillota bacterium]|nr:MAG: hypothetical protein FD169_2369 [Bacillota bacterium]MBS3950785.1 hypothetical protein [Peptococcaceae bacterium]
MSLMIEDIKPGVLDGGHWGSGDFVLINGVETWLMYFSAAETRGKLVNDLSALYKTMGID